MAKLIDFRYENNLGLKDLARDHPVALARALNRVAASVRTEISKAVREEYNIKKQDLDPNMRITNAAPNRLASMLTVKARHLPLGSFGARFLRRAKAVTVRIKRGGGAEQINAGFLVPTRFNTHVSVRKAKGTRLRPDIAFLYTIGATEMAGSREIEKRVKAKIEERLPIEIDAQLTAISKGYASAKWKR